MNCTFSPCINTGVICADFYINAETISRWISDGWQWGLPIDSETYGKALNEEWNVKLTPKKEVPHSWFGQLKGKRLLGLASGGGQQIPVFSALGAKCTVLDYNDMQLDSERLVSKKGRICCRNHKSRHVKTSSVHR